MESGNTQNVVIKCHQDCNIMVRGKGGVITIVGSRAIAGVPPPEREPIDIFPKDGNLQVANWQIDTDTLIAIIKAKSQNFSQVF